jgi:hypothetical protein
VTAMTNLDDLPTFFKMAQFESIAGQSIRRKIVRIR